MKVSIVAGAVLSIATQLVCRAYAMELCGPEDYYNLANSSKCSIKYDKAGNKNDSRELVFEVLKTYPYENKDSFVMLLERKIALVDTYITKQKTKGQTAKVKDDTNKLEQTEQYLAQQLGMVKASSRDNWVSVRDRARQALEEASQSLREVE